MIIESGTDMKTNMLLILIGAAIGFFFAITFRTFFDVALLTTAIASLNILLFIRQQLEETPGTYAEFLFVIDLTGGLVVCMWMVSIYKIIG